MPPCSTSGGITGRKKSANAALLCTNGGITGRKKFANAAVVYMWRHYYRVRMAALVVEKNSQMPPSFTCGGITIAYEWRH
jgi:hypothetical protein